MNKSILVLFKNVFLSAVSQVFFLLRVPERVESRGADIVKIEEQVSPDRGAGQSSWRSRSVKMEEQVSQDRGAGQSG